jgi:hypothetical protein
MLDPNNKRSMSTSTGHGVPGHQSKHHAARENGFAPGNERETSGPGSLNYSPGSGSQSTGMAMGEDHFGPGHAGAKVHHQCHSCGADNDISRYFRKDAVYRMQ